MSNVSKIMDSEYEVMKVLWSENPLTANEVYAILSEKKKWSKSTVITLINRLIDKGVVNGTKRGVYFYEPLISETEYKNYHADNLLNKLFNGSAKNLLIYFCDNKNITLEDVEELKKMIKSKEV